MAKTYQYEINNFIDIIKSPEKVKCQLGLVGSDGIAKDTKKDYIDLTHVYGSPEALCVIHDKKPMSTFQLNKITDKADLSFIMHNTEPEIPEWKKIENPYNLGKLGLF